MDRMRQLVDILNRYAYEYYVLDAIKANNL